MLALHFYRDTDTQKYWLKETFGWLVLRKKLGKPLPEAHSNINLVT